jgi:PIN domain nuclease of toxin-antitoxin system
LDTHIAVWLYAGLVGKLSDKAKQAIEADDVLISPIGKLELQYLFEIGRVTVQPDTIIKSLGHAIGLKVSATPFDQLIAEALKLTWTCDVFDRILSAEAIVNGCGLVTADEEIQTHLDMAVW